MKKLTLRVCLLVGMICLALSAAQAGTLHDAAAKGNLNYWLCTNREASELVHAKGIEIHGAQVEGSPDFEAATLSYPLWLFDCAIPQQINLLDAQTRTISLSGSHTGPIFTDGLTTQGGVP